MVALGLAVHDHVFAPLPALAAFVVGWMIQFAGVVTDNYKNLQQQPDDLEHPELVEAVRLGLITLRGLKLTAQACYVLALLGGVYLAWIGGWPVVIIGLASIGASWAYSAGPFPFGRHGLADPLFFAFFGIVSVMGAYYVQAVAAPTMPGLPAGAELHALSPLAFALSLPIGAMITGILIIDDIRDRDFDRVKGKNTIAVRWGAHWSRVEWLVLMALAYLAPLWFWAGLRLPGAVLLPLLSLPLAAALARIVWRQDGFRELTPATPRAAGLVVLYAALLGAGLALS